MFKGAFDKLRFQPEEGMKVLAVGRISLYMRPAEIIRCTLNTWNLTEWGALYQAYEQLKKN